MRIRKPLLLGSLAAVILGATGYVIYAQQQVQVKAGSGIDLRKITFDTQKTPDIQAGNVKTKRVDSPRDWLEIEVEFEAKDVSPRDAVIPEVIFRYYVAMTDKNNQPIVLSGDVTHVNVVAGEKYHSAAYVPPSTLGKYTGDFKRFQASSVKGIGVEILYNGVRVGGGLEGINSKFWETVAPTPGVLSRQETPFGLLWIDRYADEKKK